jgi:uncharacterized cofD-like protein
MALCALATEVDTQADLLRELFLYRFNTGEGLVGHNFGNLLLTVLTDIVGDTSTAITTAGEILRVKGKVLPVTTDNVQLVATYDSGRVIIGEHEIDVAPPGTHRERITHLSVTPKATGSKQAIEAILAADLVVLGPGDLYTSILANCVVGGIAEALVASEAKIIFVCNLMSRSGQTIGMHSDDYLTELEKYIGRRPGYLIFNETPFLEQLLTVYAAEGNHPVQQTIVDGVCQVKNCDVVSTESFVTAAGDTIERSLIRHDSQKLARAVLAIL